MFQPKSELERENNEIAHGCWEVLRMTWVGPRAASCHLSLSFLLVEVSKTFNTKCDFVQCTTRTGGLPNKIRAVALRFHATLAAASMIYKPRKCAYNIGALPF